MTDPKHKYYEIPIEDGISEEELQDQIEQGIELIKELIKAYKRTKANKI